MYYSGYLHFLSQLNREIVISFYIGQVEIIIDTGVSENTWRITTKLFNGHGKIPLGIKECLSSLNHFRWQSEGPFLKADLELGTITLVQDIPPISGYQSFKKQLQSFLEFEVLWKEFLSEFGRKHAFSG